MEIRTSSLSLTLLTVFICLSSANTPLWRGAAQGEPGAETQGRQLQRGGDIKALPSKNNRWALVIGVDDYSESQITRLSGAANDARTLADALTRYAGFPEDQVTLLASDQPSQLQPRRSTILRYLSNLRGTVPRNGLLLVSFAGHGIERRGRAFLMPSDALGVNDMTLLEDTAISVDRIKESIRATGVSQVILILDACRSDPTAGRSGADNLLTAEFRKNFNFDVRNRDIQAFVTLYATDVGERAYEYDVKRQGYFTWTLVEALSGSAANDQGQVTLQRLVDYLQVNVPKLVHRDLGAHKQQRPFAIIEGYRASDLVIAVRDSVTNPVKRPPNNEAAIEQALWDAVKDSTDQRDVKEYLAKYPNGAYVIAAQVKLRRLESAKTAAPESQPPQASNGSSAEHDSNNPLRLPDKSSAIKGSLEPKSGQPMRQSLRSHTVELQSCKISGGDVICELMLTNNSSADMEFALCQVDYRLRRRGKDATKATDNAGNQYALSESLIGSNKARKGLSYNKAIIAPRTPVRIILTFQNVPETSTSFALLRIAVYQESTANVDLMQYADFRNVNIEK